MEEKNSNKEERRKRRKYRLLILLLLTFGTGIMLATSTYAWFTSNKTVTVSTLKVTIEAKNGLQISTDATNWKSVISNADITGAHGTYSTSINQIPAIMEPVSTIGNVDTDGLMEMYYGTVGTNGTGDYVLSAVKSTETEGTDGKFIAFDLFFQVNASTRIKVTNASGVTAARLNEEALEANDTGIKNASRFAFIVEGNLPAGSAVTAMQALKVQDSTTRKIWEPNNDQHTAGGVANARDAYNITTTTVDADNTAIAYKGVKAPIPVDDEILIDSTDTNYFGDVTLFQSTKAVFDDFELVTLQPGVTKMRIYMWVEGQDVDCENNASGGAINYDLQFSVLE